MNAQFFKLRRDAAPSQWRTTAAQPKAKTGRNGGHGFTPGAPSNFHSKHIFGSGETPGQFIIPADNTLTKAMDQYTKWLGFEVEFANVDQKVDPKEQKRL
jgi:hypothetical protein